MPEEYFKLDKTIIAVVGALALNVCTWVWWASNASARISTLEKSSTDQSALVTDVAVIKSKVETIASDIKYIKERK